MSAAQHTPGPWQLLPEEADKPYLRIRGTRAGSRYRIANVHAPTYEGSDREAEETRANARLIAASPEMAALLREVLPLVDSHGNVSQSDAIRVVLSKVDGSAS